MADVQISAARQHGREEVVIVARDETVVAEPTWAWVLVWLGFPVVGAGLGWLLRLAAGWVADRPGLPSPGWFRLIDRAPEPWVSIGAVALGVLAGLVLALVAHSERLTVTVSPAQVAFVRGDTVTELTRAQVGAVFPDGKQLVLLGGGGEELAREPHDLEYEALERAFTEHGYRWHPADPYRDSYRRWVPGTPDLAPGANAVFRAREKALAKGDKDDAADLRRELGRLGLVVRDEAVPGGPPRQLWRRHTAPATGENPDPP